MQSKSLPGFAGKHLLPGVTCLILICFLLFPFSLVAISMDEALTRAVAILKNRGLPAQEAFEMVLEFANYDSKKLDGQARIIQSSTFKALQKGFPRTKIILQNEAIASVSGRAVFIKGTYQQRGNKVYVTLQAINQTSGQLIAKADVDYDSNRNISQDLVAVLNLQATTLDKTQVRIFSKVFRSGLTKSGKMNLIASDYMDSVDTDKIQQEFQCTRDECGTMIAQQLNASQVITPVYEKVTDNLCYLIASWKDIASGRTLNEVSMEHSCQLETLGKAMEELACQLTATCGQPTLITLIAGTQPAPQPEPDPKPEPIVAPRPAPEPEEPSDHSIMVLSFGLPWGYTYDDITVTSSGGYKETYKYEADGDPAGFYIHLGFGYTRGFWGFSWLNITQPIVSTDNRELTVNALDFDWTKLIGGHFALGFGAGMNWSNINCDTCSNEAGVGFQFLGKIGIVGDSIGFMYSLHIIGSSSKNTVTDESGNETEYTYRWGGTASVLSLVIKF